MKCSWYWTFTIFLCGVSVAYSAVATPSMQINYGSTTGPIVNDLSLTDIGSVAINIPLTSLAFVIQNFGDTNLLITGSVTVVWQQSPDGVVSDIGPFSIPQQPTSTPITPYVGVNAFYVGFQPGTKGLWKASISVPNNSGHNPYNFQVQATATVASLTVTIAPQAANDAGALWSMDGGVIWYYSGETIDNVTPGNAVVSFKPIPGWSKPDNQSFYIPAGQPATRTGWYTKEPISVTVFIHPQEAVDAEAMWQVDGGDWQSSGATVGGLTPDQPHTVSYKQIPGWIVPTDSIFATGSSIDAYYTQNIDCSLTVNIEPQTAIEAGAQWSVDSGITQASGTTVMLPAGSHTISYTRISGWTAPGNQTVTFTAGQSLTTTGIYTSPVILTLAPPALPVALGAVFSVTLSVQDVTNLGGFQIGLAFDPTKLQVMTGSVALGSFLTQDGNVPISQPGTIDNTAGIISGYAWARTGGTGISGSGSLATIQFHEILGATTGYSTLITLSSTDMLLSSPTGTAITVDSFAPATVEFQPESTFEGQSEGNTEGAIEGQGEGEGWGEGEVAPFEGSPEEGQSEGQIEGSTEGVSFEGSLEEGEGVMEGQIDGEGQGEPHGAHTADQDGDGQINLSELLRVIQFFNSGGYHCQSGTEDGYAPGTGVHDCTPHDSDYNTQDWFINLSELLRVIQFFNSGGYHCEPGTEDGYAPGPGPMCETEGEGMSSEGSPEEGSLEEGEGTIEGIVEGEGSTEGILEGQVEGIIEGEDEGMLSEGSPEEGEGGIEGIVEGEGSLEGVIEGGPEGAIEGIVEGSDEGTIEGGIEGGIDEGEAEGQDEGVSEGVIEGEAEGLSEGEGSPEGQDEGESVTIWYVTPDGIGDGSSWNNALGTIQAAIDAAYLAGGGEVWVYKGLYAPIIMRRNVAIYGGFAGTETQRDQRNWSTNRTAIDGDNTESCVTGSDNATLDGFFIQNGYADHDNGGGMHNYETSPVVANCTFTENMAFYGSGAGMYNAYSSPILINCTFSENTAMYEQYGGGMYNFNSSPSLINCIFFQNMVTNTDSSSYGGGMYNESSSPTLTSCIFVGNVARNDRNAASYGGGMYNADSSSPTLTNCTFIGNTSTAYSGAMHNNSSSPTLINCTFTGNTANDSFGGLYNDTATPILINCILWEDMPAAGPEIYDVNSTPSVTYSCIQGDSVYSGTGNINLDPLFVDATSGNVQLQFGSPCIDTGTVSGAPATDTIGTVRPQGNGFDMGVYEYIPVGEGGEEGEGMVEGESEGGNEGEMTIMLPSDVPLEMVWIPAGSFMMGRCSGGNKW